MTISIHHDWSTTAFDRSPLADATGPFPRRSFLHTWWRLRGKGRIMLVESESALLPLMASDDLGFMGEADLCDYHTPLGTGVADAAAALPSQLPTGTRLVLDSLPAEASDPIAAGLRSAGAVVDVTQHEVAAVLSLPTSTDAWLASLSRKQRHEVRRKARRFTAEAGGPHLRRGTKADLATFISLHRKASGDKGGFMDHSMERWFAALVAEAGARVDILDGQDGAPLAAAVGFEDEAAYYLYNSAYEPSASHISPGVVLVIELVARAISEGRTVFDFLKGDESYKFKLGARPRPLYTVTTTIGEPS